MLIAPFEYVSWEYQDDQLYIIEGEHSRYPILLITPGFGNPEPIAISRLLFDKDDDIELILGQQIYDQTDGSFHNLSEYAGVYDSGGDGTADYKYTAPIQKRDGAYASATGGEFGEWDVLVKLAGNTPEYDHTIAIMQSAGINPPPGEPRADTIYQITRDTVYLTETISRIDTIRELITERIFTSDTVYINETITLAGDVDTLVINRTVTTRDTVYNFTEHTEYITRVDSLYLLGGDYLADLNSVTSVENQLEVEKLSNPYPNPASTTVSVDYVTAVPTSNMFLGVYDNQGRRVEQFPVKPSHTITFDVSDWAPGVYVYMIWSPVGVSSTKRLVVQ